MGLRHEINALCRGAIVLLSARVEAYVKEVGGVALDAMHSKRVPRARFSDRVFYYASKSILDEIQDTEDPDKIAAKVFSFLQSDGGLWSKTSSLPTPIDADRFSKGFSNPSFGKVCAYFGRFGYSNYSRDLGRILRARYGATTNMINHLVETRNNIAHGDPSATKTPDELRDMMILSRLFCRTTDSVFASWCGSSLCRIR